MAVLAVLIPLLMLGVVLALGRYEELLLPAKKADPGEDALAGSLGATMPLPVLRSAGPVRTHGPGKNPAASSARRKRGNPARDRSSSG
jgi:hypothetical protein